MCIDKPMFVMQNTDVLYSTSINVNDNFNDTYDCGKMCLIFSQPNICKLNDITLDSIIFFYVFCYQE